MVTAAVYRGFNQELAPHHLTFRHRAGVTLYTSTFVFAECYVFIKQSQPPFHCNPILLHARGATHTKGTPFPEVRCYFAEFLLLSSLSALEFSSYPPVSVYGTVFIQLKLSGFSWKHGIAHLALRGVLRYHVSTKPSGFA